MTWARVKIIVVAIKGDETSARLSGNERREWRHATRFRETMPSLVTDQFRYLALRCQCVRTSASVSRKDVQELKVYMRVIQQLKLLYRPLDDPNNSSCGFKVLLLYLLTRYILAFICFILFSVHSSLVHFIYLFLFLFLLFFSFIDWLIHSFIGLFFLPVLFFCRLSSFDMILRSWPGIKIITYLGEI